MVAPLFALTASTEVIERTYRFPAPKIRTAVLDGATYHRIALSREVSAREALRGDNVRRFSGNRTYPSMGEPGAPLLPRVPVMVPLPPGHGVERIEVIPSRSRRLPGRFRPWPSQPAFPLSRDIAPAPVRPDPAIYEGTGIHPEALHDAVDIQYSRGRPVTCLTLSPVRFRPDRGAIRYVERITVRIHTRPEAPPSGVRRLRGGIEDRQRWIRLDGDRCNDSGDRSGPRGKGKTNPLKIPGGPAGRIPGAPGHDPEALYDYVIITSQALADDPGPFGFGDLMAHREARGLRCELVTVESIRTAFPGMDDAERIRNFLIEAYTKHGATYVLLGGDGDEAGAGAVVPARGFYATCEGVTEKDLKSDLYYSNLDGTFDYNGNGLYGELDDGPDGGEVDLLSELYVGRAPVASADELHRWVAKVLAYETGDWADPAHTGALFLGEHLWNNPTTWGGDYMDEIRSGASGWGYVSAGYPSTWARDRLYEKYQSWGPSDLRPILSSDTLCHVNHLGHANTTIVMQLGLSDVDALTNQRPFFAYSQGCMAGDFSKSECMAERFLTAEHGAHAVIMNDKYGWGELGCTDGSSQYLHRQFADALFGEGIREAGAANADSKEDNIWCVNYKGNRWCLYETNLFGDPATPLIGPLSGTRGILALDRGAYRDGAKIVLTADDADLNLDPGRREQVVVSLTSASGDAETVILFEVGPDAHRFKGSLNLEAGPAFPGDDVLEAMDGDLLEATYVDEDTGFGGQQVPVIAQAAADFTPPVLSAVTVKDVDFDRARVGWQADENVRGRVVFGLGGTFDRRAESHQYVTAPEVSLTDLVQCSDYRFRVEAEDGAGHLVTDDNGGLGYTLATLQRVIVLDERLNEDPGWSTTGGSWAFGPPLGLEGDPATGFTGLNVFGNDLDGAYPDNLGTCHLVTPPIDCSGLTGTRLTFKQILGVESNKSDLARLALSKNGTTWQTLYENPPSDYVDPCWMPLEYDLSALADGEPAVLLRFTLGPTNGSIHYGGWNLDDLLVFGAAPPSGPWLEPAELVIDDSSGGDGDGTLNPGETAFLEVRALNTGLDAAGPMGTLRCFTPSLTLLDDTADFPALKHLETGGTSAPHFEVALAADAEDGSELLFDLTWTDGASSGTFHFSEIVKAPRMSVAGMTVDDAGGDQDGHADPGETIALALTFANMGSIEARNVTAQLQTSAPQYATVLAGSAAVGDVPVNGTTGTQSPHFTVALDPTTPNYEPVPFTVSLTGDNLSVTLDLILEVTASTIRFAFDLDQDPGFKVQDKWAFGPPQGVWPAAGCPDPESGYTGANVYGFNLAGGYPVMALKVYRLTSIPLDLSGCADVRVRYRRWLGVAAYDGAAFLVSTDGQNWTEVWDHGTERITDNGWVLVEHDLSAIADGQPTVWLRWTQGPFASGQSHCGWNLDDIEIWGR